MSNNGNPSVFSMHYEINTARDKILQLLGIEKSPNLNYSPTNLVKVQHDELMRLKNDPKKSNYLEYINQLYKHYIVEGKNKLYLCK